MIINENKKVSNGSQDLTVIFNAECPATPDFRIHVRPSRHEPDLFYTNKNMALVEKELFQ
jgi:hypothetical protein